MTTSANPAYSRDDDGYVLGHTSEVMRLMAGLVAATGQVTGIDRDDRLGQEPLHVLRDTVPGRFAVVHADVETADAVPGGPFDLAFARFLLVFARDPAALVRKLYGWTRPGGVLLMQEYDPRTFDIEPQLSTWDEFERVLYGSFRRAGVHPHIGRQLPHLFAAADLGSPDGTDVAGLLTPLHDILPLYEAAYHSSCREGNPDALGPGRITGSPATRRSVVYLYLIELAAQGALRRRAASTAFASRIPQPGKPRGPRRPREVRWFR